MKQLLFIILIILFVVFCVWFSNHYTREALKTFDDACKGRVDTSFDCIEYGKCTCTNK